MRHLNIDVPDQFLFVLNENEQELTDQMKLFTAMQFYKTHKLTLKQAADFAGLTLLRFITELDNNEIPVIDYDPEDLKAELDTFK